MRRQLRLGNESFTFQNESLERVYLNLHVIHNLANASIANSEVDLSQLRVSVKLTQKGITKETSFNGVPAVAHTYMTNNSIGKLTNANFNADGYHAGGTTILTKTASIKEQAMILCMVTDSPIVLKGSDKLEITFDIDDSIWGTNVSSASKVYMVTESGTDLVQSEMALMSFIPLTADKSDVQLSFSSLEYLSLLDTGTSQESNTIPWSQVDLSSKYYKEQYSIIDLISNNIMDVSSTVGTGSETYGSHELFDGGKGDGKNLYGVRLNLNIDVSKITAKNQWIAVRGISMNRSLAMEGARRHQKIRSHKMAVRGIR